MTKMFENIGPMWRVTPEQVKQNQKDWYQANKGKVKAQRKLKKENKSLQIIEEPPKNERFKVPTDKQLVEIAILFNDGRVDREELTNLIAISEFIINRLYEHGDVTQKSSKED